jgi:hypothetical protein
MLQHVSQTEPEPFKLSPCKPSRSLAWPEPGTKQALVRINVAHPSQESLVEERSLDAKLSPPKQASELRRIDRQRLRTCGAEACAVAQIPEFQAPKSTWIYKAKLASTCQAQSCMGMRGDKPVRRSHKQPPSHAQVHNPLRLRFAQARVLGLNHSHTF